MFVASLTFDSSMSAILARLVFLATVTSTLAIAERPTTRETTTDRTIQKTQVLNVNPNIEIYMAAERGFITKPSDTFDGQTKSFEDFQFDMQNTLTYTAMTARGEMERGAAQVMMTILERGGRMTLDESKNLVFTGTEEEQKQAKAANDLLFTILALNTTGRARQIVKETTSKRSGVEAWVRLRERVSKTTGATSYAEIFKYNWHGGKSFEDKWRDWTSKM